MNTWIHSLANIYTWLEFDFQLYKKDCGAIKIFNGETTWNNKTILIG